MAKFIYRATDRKGTQKTGQLDAPSEAAVIQKLREQGLIPISVKVLAHKSKSGASGKRFKLFERISRKEVLEFTSKMSILADAGIQLDRSLAIVTDLTENEKMKEVIKDIRRNVQGGTSFGDALAKHPKVFNRLYVNMVRSGEAGGVLETILQRLSGFLESSEALRDEIVSASIYPVLLIIIGAVVVGMMVTFVLPKFTVIFVNMGATLPLPTQILVSVTNFIKKTWFFLVAGLAIFIAVLKQYINTEDGRMKWDNLKLKLPLIGDLILKIEVARFARTLGTLIRAGVQILQALSIVKDTLTNEVIASSLLPVYSKLKEGGGLSAPLRETECFPPLAVHMIAVGEETGSLESMLLKVADTYEKEVRVTVNRVMSLIEPLLIIAMGLIVGFVVVSMLLAVFSISDMPI